MARTCSRRCQRWLGLGSFSCVHTTANNRHPRHQAFIASFVYYLGTQSCGMQHDEEGTYDGTGKEQGRIGKGHGMGNPCHAGNCC
jgi:hypothetical protein